MSKLTIEAIRTEGNQLFKMVTGLGQNGLLPFTVRNINGKVRDVTGLDLRFVVKTVASALDVELSPNFPLTPTIVDGPNGKIAVDMATIDFLKQIDSVCVILAENVSGILVPISHGGSFIVTAGIAVT